MTRHEFDRRFWEQRWGRSGSMGANPPNPHLLSEIGDLVRGTALDAGCGAGAEAIWLAAHGWDVTAVDLSSTALARAAERATGSGVSERLRWVEADLGVWDPGTRFDLVTTHYAHPAMPQLDFYDRVASWVAPGGTLLIVGHLHTHDATAASVRARLDAAEWEIVTADERRRTLTGPEGREVTLHDVVVRATRRRR